MDDFSEGQTRARFPNPTMAVIVGGNRLVFIGYSVYPPAMAGESRLNKRSVVGI